MRVLRYVMTMCCLAMMASAAIGQEYGSYGGPTAPPVNVGYTEAGYESIVKRLSALERRAQNEDLSELKSDIKKKVDSGHSGSSMKVVGRVHVDAWGFPNAEPGIFPLEGGDPQNRLNFRRMRFGVRGKLPANMEYRIEMEFAGGNNAEFRDAWLGWNDLPFLRTLLLGNQKRPYGLDHLNSSRYNVFIERPFVIESFNQDARRLGLASYGFSENQAWNWRYGLYNQRLIQDEGNYINDHLQMEFASRLANTFWYDECSGGRGYAHWAVAGTYARPDGNTGGGANTVPHRNEARFRHRPEARSVNRWLDTGVIAGADNYTLVGIENVWNFGALQFVGEYQHVWLERDLGVAGAGATDDDLRFHGGYLYVSYFLTGEHIPWNRKAGVLGRVKPFENFFAVRTCDGGIERGLGAWQIACRVSYADFVDDNIVGGKGDSYTFGLNWHWTPYARMQFNWIHGRIRENDDSPALAALGGHYDIVGARFMVDF